jgi:hypothetical protein
MEEWKDIPKFEGLYQVSSLGRVRSLDRTVPRKLRGKDFTTFVPGQLRVLTKNKKGYMVCRLSKLDVSHHFLVHRLVAYAFLPPCTDPLFQLNHKNTKKDDNRPENLEWVSARDNMRHAAQNGLINKKGTRNGRAKLNESIVQSIKGQIGLVDPDTLAETYKISRCTINDIIKGRTWTHV